jgi:hypothetical protein
MCKPNIRWEEVKKLCGMKYLNVNSHDSQIIFLKNIEKPG